MSDLPKYPPSGGPYIGGPGLPLGPLYYQRDYYKNSAPFRYSINNKNYIDLWYDVPFYGKVNQKGVFYVPNSDKVDFSLDDNASAYKFVLDAYNDFRYFLRKADGEGKANFESLVGTDYKIKRGYVDSINAYDSYMKQNINDHNKKLLYSNIVIPDLLAWTKDFIEKHELFTKILSFYSFYANTRTNILSTGLALSFESFDHNSDEKKWLYYANPHFVDYAQAAANFGFRINLNAPWQIIADLNSKPMRGFITKKAGPNGQTTKIDGYLAQHTIPTGNDPHKPNLDYFFETQCTKAIRWSYFLLQEYILAGWEDYRKLKQNMVIHAKPAVTIQNFKAASSSKYFRSPPTIITLKKQKPEQISATTWFTILEKILRYEFNAQCDAKYRKFRKKYDNLKKEGPNNVMDDDKANEALTKLEEYYNMTKIFNPNTGKPDWQTKKDLTEQKIYDSMLYEKKPHPTVSEASKDHYVTYGKSAIDYYGN